MYLKKNNNKLQNGRGFQNECANQIIERMQASSEKKKQKYTEQINKMFLSFVLFFIRNRSTEMEFQFQIDLIRN